MNSRAWIWVLRNKGITKLGLLLVRKIGDRCRCRRVCLLLALGGRRQCRLVLWRDIYIISYHGVINIKLVLPLYPVGQVSICRSTKVINIYIWGHMLCYVSTWNFHIRFLYLLGIKMTFKGLKLLFFFVIIFFPNFIITNGYSSFECFYFSPIHIFFLFIFHATKHNIICVVYDVSYGKENTKWV